jgi:hypothetical protein
VQPIDVDEPEPEPVADRARTSKRLLLLVAVPAVVLVVAVGAVVVVQARRNEDVASARAARQAQVEQNGAQVMPFDQNLTTHQFTKTDTGGVETVTAKDPNDGQQTTLVQDHLQHERDLFSAGDFSDPMAIHGRQMPGIADLQHGATSGEVTVTYEALPAGARLTYRAETPALVATVHTWFDAQLMDHGSHAMG